MRLLTEIGFTVVIQAFMLVIIIRTIITDDDSPKSK